MTGTMSQEFGYSVGRAPKVCRAAGRLPAGHGLRFALVVRAVLLGCAVSASRGGAAAAEKLELVAQGRPRATVVLAAEADRWSEDAAGGRFSRKGAVSPLPPSGRGAGGEGERPGVSGRG